MTREQFTDFLSRFADDSAALELVADRVYYGHGRSLTVEEFETGLLMWTEGTAIYEHWQTAKHALSALADECRSAGAAAMRVRLGSAGRRSAP
jgi:hypothetical protein